MLTRLAVRNFKTLEDIDIELGQSVVFIGPNNSGKTSALQALALWQSGVNAMVEQPGAAWPGPALNRLSLTHTPVTDAAALWRNLNPAGDPAMSIEVEGQGPVGSWSLGLEFHLSNRESLHCWPTRIPRDVRIAPLDLETAASLAARIAFLPPMSGLATEETEVPPGRIDVLIGEGQTAQILRNLCLRILETDPASWLALRFQIRGMFGTTLGDPARLPARGTITLTYEQQGHVFDIGSAGRGMQQTLLLLAHIAANPGSTLLLDEPDAHLEILRQRQIYNVLTEHARSAGSQIIAASHSEVILNEAAARDVVIAFVGRRPHRIVDRGSQLLKSLREIGFDQYYQADLTGAVLYLEGATDLAVLRALAHRLEHPAAKFLENVFAHYVANQPTRAQQHFAGLREARADLVGFALFDRLERGLPPSFAIPAHCWKKCEIENYIASRDVLLRFAVGSEPDDPKGEAVRSQRHDAMQRALDDVEQAFRTLGADPWSDDVKMSDQVLPAVFSNFYKNLGLRNEINKADYHFLVEYNYPGLLDPEIVDVLDGLDDVLRRARPA